MKQYSYLTHGSYGMISIISVEDGESEEIMSIWPPLGDTSRDQMPKIRVAAAAIVAAMERSEADRTAGALDGLPRKFGGSQES